MIVYRWNGTMERIFICDACGREIADRADVRVLREEGALPEEKPSYLHADCFEPFLLEQDSSWEPSLLSSSTAAWFI